MRTIMATTTLGMLVASPGRQLSRTLQGLVSDLSETGIEQAFAAMETEGRASLAEGDGDASYSTSTIVQRILAERAKEELQQQ